MSQIVIQAEGHFGRPVTNVEAAEYACEHIKMQVKLSSWAVYRSKHLNSIADEEERKLVKQIYSEKGRNAPGVRRKNRPSSRAKDFSVEHLNALCNELKRERYSRWGREARLWLTAIYYAGLRPSESPSVRIINIDGEPHARIKNAKLISVERVHELAEVVSMQGRNTSVFRNVPLSHLDPQIIDVIGYVAAVTKRFTEEGAYNTYYEGVRKAIARAAKAMNPSFWSGKTPSLYSARHGFRDSWREMLFADGLSSVQVDLVVAVLMGHGSTKTNYAYGMDSSDRQEKERTAGIKALSPSIKVLLQRAISDIE